MGSLLSLVPLKVSFQYHLSGVLPLVPLVHVHSECIYFCETAPLVCLLMKALFSTFAEAPDTA